MVIYLLEWGGFISLMGSNTLAFVILCNQSAADSMMPCDTIGSGAEVDIGTMYAVRKVGDIWP